MTKFLTTSGIVHQLENIIINSCKKLVLVSPYIQISKIFLERLKEASDRGVKITIVYGKSDLNSSERKSLEDIRNVELYFLENLHAKCYFNEDKLIVTSMNMYAFSEKTNREMGILFDRKKDFEIFDQAVNETLSIVKAAKEIKLNGNLYFVKEFSKSAVVRPKTGFCIRCEADIKFNPESPYCYSCFSIWKQFENYFYEENVCHRCGKEESSCMDKPECKRCYNTKTYA